MVSNLVFIELIILYERINYKRSTTVFLNMLLKALKKLSTSEILLSRAPAHEDNIHISV